MNCSQKVKNDKNHHLWLYMMTIVWNISTFLYNTERIFTNGSLRLQWLNGIGSWGVCDAGWDFFVPWLGAKPQEPMTIAWVNRSQQFHQPWLVIRTFHRQGRCSRGGHLCNQHSEEKYSCSYKYNSTTDNLIRFCVDKLYECILISMGLGERLWLLCNN